MQITNETALNLNDAMGRVDPPVGTAPALRFKMATWLALCRNKKALGAVSKDFQEAHAVLIEKYTPDGMDQVPPENVKAFRAEYKEALIAPVEVAIETIRLKDVEIEKNPLRVDVGAVLLGVIILEEGHHTNETTPPAAAP